MIGIGLGFVMGAELIHASMRIQLTLVLEVTWELQVAWFCKELEEFSSAKSIRSVGRLRGRTGVFGGRGGSPSFERSLRACQPS